VKAELDDLRIPTFVTHGEDDRLVPAQATEALGRIPGVTRAVYPGLRHETLFEPEGPEVTADIITWLREAASRVR
jgi:alpha-beta hydrolase superfamily lysophospholipase